METVNVLFILDKWCAGIESSGISEWETNIWKSLETTGFANIRTFHYDEYSQRSGKQGDSALLLQCTQEKPDLICIVIYKRPGSDNTVPTIEALNTLNYTMEIPVVAIWGDLQSKALCSVADEIVPFTNLNIYTALYDGSKNVVCSDTFMYTWVPKDQLVFRDFAFVRDIPLTYIGSSRPFREDMIKFLKDNEINIYRTGGEREKHISTLEYAKLLNRSQINLSFSRAGVPPVHVINARVFETMLCGAMLLEQESDEMLRFYEPFVDYVPYQHPMDMVDKIKYYLLHQEERLKIAKSGCVKTVQKYNAKLFWQNIFIKLNMWEE